MFFYAVLGGMKGITYTQVAQYCILIFAFMVPAIFISIMMTGNPVPQLGFGDKLADGTYLLDKLDGLHKELGFATYTNGSKSIIDVFCIAGALMVGTAGLPHVIVRFFTVPKVKDARLSAGSHWFLLRYFTPAPAIAVFARSNLIEMVKDAPYSQMAGMVSQMGENRSYKVSDKNADGKIQYVADAAINELTIDQDIIVLANPEIARLPIGLSHL